ncbi:MAG: tetratricopeptide (TPR) repeat protein [Limisphaerales bacterium]|jgi:tetratricopeptide (TPR) repeat protein
MGLPEPRMRKKSRNLFTSAFLLLWSMSNSMSSLAEDASQQAQAIQDPTTGTLDFLQNQISVGEADEAINQLNGLVRQIELARHRYHEDLLTPVTLLGDAYIEQGEFTKAIDHYDRARHIARVSHGLFHPSQIQVLYKEANALMKIGDTQTSGKREEYAYEVARRSYDEYDLEILPAIQRLSAFYLRSGNPLAARALLNRAQLINQKNNTEETDTAVDILRAIAQSHRLERFPPMYVDAGVDNGEDAYVASLRNRDLDSQVRYINSFPAGERALQKVVSIKREKFGDDSDEASSALLELADWHLMFNRQHAATTMYRHIYFTLQGEDESPEGKGDAFFIEPVMLYFPQPENPKVGSSTSDATVQGQIALTFVVSPTGKVRAMQTTEVVGPKNMNFRVRRSMRLAIFRPQLVAGNIVTSQDQSFAYQFPYIPKSEKMPNQAVQQDQQEAISDQPQGPTTELETETTGATRES